MNDPNTPPTARAAQAPSGVMGSPKAYFLAAAGLSFLMSVGLFFTGDHERGIFVGIWVPSILSLGALMLAENSND